MGISRIRYHFSVDDKICNVELWSTEFYPILRDCIIPVHHILGRFIPIKYQINTKDYLAINPINKKYYIH